MITTIISNNCTGGAVCHELGMEFRTPTINLQILPEDYPRFCTNLGEYMEKELYEARLLLQQDREKLFKMFGGIPDFPNKPIVKAWRKVLGNTKPKHDYTPPEMVEVVARIEYRDIMLNRVLNPGDAVAMPYERAMELIDKGFVTKKDKKG